MHEIEKENGEHLHIATVVFDYAYMLQFVYIIFYK